MKCVRINSRYLQRGDPIELRYKEHSERGPVIDQLVYRVTSYREAAMSNDSKFEHIEVAEKQKVSQLVTVFFRFWMIKKLFIVPHICVGV